MSVKRSAGSLIIKAVWRFSFLCRPAAFDSHALLHGRSKYRRHIEQSVILSPAALHSVLSSGTATLISVSL